MAFTNISTKETSYEVYRVNNGFIVRRPTDRASGNYSPIEASYVFNEWADCALWLAEHLC